MRSRNFFSLYYCCATTATAGTVGHYADPECSSLKMQSSTGYASLACPLLECGSLGLPRNRVNSREPSVDFLCVSIYDG